MRSLQLLPTRKWSSKGRTSSPAISISSDALPSSSLAPSPSIFRSRREASSNLASHGLSLDTVSSTATRTARTSRRMACVAEVWTTEREEDDEEGRTEEVEGLTAVEADRRSETKGRGIRGAMEREEKKEELGGKSACRGLVEEEKRKRVSKLTSNGQHRLLLSQFFPFPLSQTQHVVGPHSPSRSYRKDPQIRARSVRPHLSPLSSLASYSNLPPPPSLSWTQGARSSLVVEENHHRQLSGLGGPLRRRGWIARRRRGRAEALGDGRGAGG